jgi:hypothetical protein
VPLCAPLVGRRPRPVTTSVISHYHQTVVEPPGQLSPDGQWRWDGQTWNPTDLQPPIARPNRRITFVVVGGLLVAVGFVGGVLATAIASWANSVCNDDSATVNASRQALRLDVLFIWLVATGVPVALAAAAKRRDRHVWPWVAVAGMFLLIAAAITLSIQPAKWCLY